MEPADPSLQNGLLETHRYFPGASNWNTSGAKLVVLWRVVHFNWSNVNLNCIHTIANNACGQGKGMKRQCP